MYSKISLYELYLACLEDDQWFGELFSKTYSAVFYAHRRCNMQEWELDDIKQEARIILFYTLQHFQMGKIHTESEFERLFYAYYQRSLMNHFLNLRRYATAMKRNIHCNVYTDELDYFFASEAEVENLAIQRLKWQQTCLLYFTAEECQLLARRMQGLSIRRCAYLSHHGTRYTTRQLRRLQQYLKDQ